MVDDRAPPRDFPDEQEMSDKSRLSRKTARRMEEARSWPMRAGESSVKWTGQYGYQGFAFENGGVLKTLFRAIGLDIWPHIAMIEMG